MREVGACLQQAGVRAIYLVHGTFVGADALGLMRTLSLVAPEAAASFSRLSKDWIDRWARDAGNYDTTYADELQKALDSPSIAVRRFVWSSENNHIGRADAAVRLLAELMQRPEAEGERILLWGHSHAGSVFALITNLVASEPADVARFFSAGRPFYQWPGIRIVDRPVWADVRQRLLRQSGSLRAKLDVVTFGTPIRYGWESSGYGNLAHFVNHRSMPGLAAYQAPFPPSPDDVMHGTAGDCIQALGIAGTNIAPNVLRWRSLWADLRLGRFLQPGRCHRELLRRLRLGRRVPEEGETLLVDYAAADPEDEDPLAGHAVYTRASWMLFHAEEICRRFYA